MNHTDRSRQKGPITSISRAWPGDGTEIVNDDSHVIGSVYFYIFIIKRILLTGLTQKQLFQTLRGL
jgi:hypothetical protein